MPNASKPSPIPLKWVHGNKALIETGHITFDRYCNCIGTGNICSDCQMGACIRPRTETECNGRTWKEGELRDFDLKPFRESLHIPPNVYRRVLEATETEGANLSVFYHYRGSKITVHGYILTKGYEENHKLLWKIPTGPTKKSAEIIDWCAKRVST